MRSRDVALASAILAWAPARSLSAEPPPVSIPIEVVVGEERTQTEFFFYAPVDDRGQASLFSLGRFGTGYRDDADDRVFLSSQAIINANRWLGLTVGGAADSSSVRPGVGLSLFFGDESGKNYVNLLPTLFVEPHGEDFSDDAVLEFLIVASSTIPVDERWGIFSQLILPVGLSVALDEHRYSAPQLRLGASLEGIGQFGFALDQDYIGSGDDFSYEDNIGLFVRRAL
ncbi:MAG: hypothetical protein AAF605_07365 [Myxococcota bacterium]